MPRRRDESEKGRPGLLIVDHGTRSPRANARLAALAAEIRRDRPDWIVRHAHMELAEPDFEGAIARLVDAGAERILVHLHFLGEGYHVRETIPSLIAAARRCHPTVSIEATPPLGDDPRIKQIVLDRMEGTKDENAPTPEEAAPQSSPARQSSKA